MIGGGGEHKRVITRKNVNSKFDRPCWRGYKSVDVMLSEALNFQREQKRVDCHVFKHHSFFFGGGGDEVPAPFIALTDYFPNILSMYERVMAPFNFFFLQTLNFFK